ncbi:MAG TPA: NAD(P)H-dependent glycerol-3-phosphate dehydrogenase [Chitinophagaceae bacterium]|nr:NAD(P)H-dependent glycerol-3-phosphate dehydrogenase [Chitinophagaceae bacterium]
MRSNVRYRVGLVGSGSWATALAKILTDNHFRINWWMRKEADIRSMHLRKYNPSYLSSVRFDLKNIILSSNATEVILNSDWVIFCIPSAFIREVLEPLPRQIFGDKSVISAIKGIIPGENILLNEYLLRHFQFPLTSYFTIMGPCHAEEVAAQKLTYITFSGKDYPTARSIAKRFITRYLKTVVNDDIWGAQYGAVLKNIYAIGAGIAHSLGYGDNFLSVYIANCAGEMTAFNDAVNRSENHIYENRNPFAGAYLGDLLVTCYSPYSRNRSFGTMIGKGYTVRAAQMEMNMVAEGYYAARCIHEISQAAGLQVPMAENIYSILYEQLSPFDAFGRIEKMLI